MYARVSSNMIPKGKVDEVSKMVRETTWPATKKQKGYKGYLTLVNKETGEAMGISLWDTEEDMIASEKTHYPEARKRSIAAGVNFISMKHFEVGIKD